MNQQAVQRKHARDSYCLTQTRTYLGVFLCTLLLLSGCVLGAECRVNSDCTSGYCANGRFCAPQDGTGQIGDYCHHDNQCASGDCRCPGDLNTEETTFCSNWEIRTGAEQGMCAARSPNGSGCSRNENCLSLYCADGIVCAPRDGTGQAGDYCHHGNQCTSGACLCPAGLATGNTGFCPEWEFWTRGERGACLATTANGVPCTRNAECTSGYCADGRFCAPPDGTGQAGEYCHHGNHCASNVCQCPSGLTTRGFCPNWEFGVTVTGQCTP